MSLAVADALAPVLERPFDLHGDDKNLHLLQALFQRSGGICRVMAMKVMMVATRFRLEFCGCAPPEPEFRHNLHPRRDLPMQVFAH